MPHLPIRLTNREKDSKDETDRFAHCLSRRLRPDLRGGYAANSVAFDTGYPKSDVTGKIIGVGSYSLDAGWEVTMMTMYASPTGGGQGAAASCTYDAGAWNAAITGLTSGSTYNVQVVMTVRNRNTFATQTIFTTTVQVKVK
jgi:hypothetical protein